MGIFAPTTAQQLATIRANQTQIIIPDLATLLTNQVKIMAVLDDLNAAVSKTQAAVAAAIALIQTLHTSGGGGSVTDAEVEMVVGQLNTAATDLGGAVPLP